MTALVGYRLIDVPRERGREMLDIAEWAFTFAAPPAEVEGTLDHFPFERGRGIEVADAARGDVGTIVGVHASFDFTMRLPGGGTLPTAGLTWVGVHQGHRRRGLLTAMIDDHFARSIARREAVSTLWAAEPAIYQRFGYGLASRDVRMKIGRKPDLRPVAGSDELAVTLATASIESHAPVIRASQAHVQRPGANINIPEPLMQNLFFDPESARVGTEALRFISVTDGDDVVAWALFRRKGDWNEWDPKGIVNVPAWGAHTAAASRRLWSVLTDLDLMVSTHTWLMAVDDPMLHLLVDERAAKPELRDNLWLRVLDVKAALEARSYEADCDITLEIADPQVAANAGVWRMRVEGGAATVTDAGATGAAADIAMGIQELGAAYLGGTSIDALMNAGLVTERTPGSGAALGRAMRSSLAPVCNISF